MARFVLTRGLQFCHLPYNLGKGFSCKVPAAHVLSRRDLPPTVSGGQRLWQWGKFVGASMRSSVRITLWYLLGASAWIITSDVVVGVAANESAESIVLNNLKGIGFVVVTTGLLYWVLEREFSRRRAAESVLRRIERAVENLDEGVVVIDYHDDPAESRIEYVNPAMERLSGYSEAELIGQPPRILQGERVDHDASERVRQARREGRSVSINTTNYRKDGTPYIVEGHLSPVPGEQDEGGEWVVVIRDVTAQVEAAEQLRQAEERYRTLVEHVPAVIYTIQADDNGGSVQFVSPQIEDLFGYPVDEWSRDPALWQKCLHPDDSERVITNMVRHFDERAPFRFEYRIVHRDGHVAWVQDEASHDTEANGDAIWRGVLTDITRLKRTEEDLSTHVNRLASLRAIDLAITSNLEMRVMLGVVLDQVVSELRADAASILLLDEATITLRYAAGHGFSGIEIGDVNIRLGEGLAGISARDNQMVVVPDVSLDCRVDDRILELSGGAGAYVAASLRSKGHTTGVLEVFIRQPVDPDPDWLSFLDAVGAQAAIAIDNVTLFERLQRSMAELEQSYDATLAGLAGALELRDDETGGHSERVTDLSVKLARELELDDRQVTNIRRGALLHDVGKIGIPDGILRKAGPLNPQEWDLMKQHATLGYQLLQRCHLPREVLEIPFGHHERWDGSGYPLGLSGVSIPLAARIFAVVDVWDALTRDRPYRSAWSEDEAYEYLRTEAGRLFDPQIVDVFLTRVMHANQMTAEAR